MSDIRCDCVVIGGGPAGAAVSTILAGKGHHVVVLEKESFPRYKIGESLIPYCWFPLQRLGMIEKLRASHFTKKLSVQFVNVAGKVSAPFYFTMHTDHECASTWQVLRSEFDQMLLDNAREHGAIVHIRTSAKEFIREDDAVVGVRAEDSEGRQLTFRAPITMDASGRSLFGVEKNGWRVSDPTLKKIAIWSYYKGAMRDPGLDAGATTVAYVPEKGWFWYIPLPDDVVSVGIVAERDYLYRDGRDPDAIFAREVGIQPWIKAHVAAGTKMAPCRVTGDYSYRARHCASDGLVLVGDAFAFLDPVFSSGVFLALYSGVMAGDAADSALRAGDCSAERFTEYGTKFRTAIEAMRRLVYTFYDPTFRFADVLRDFPHLKSDLTDCLIGNAEKDYDPLFEAIGRYADVPKPLPHGLPLIGAKNVR